MSKYEIKEEANLYWLWRNSEQHGLANNAELQFWQQLQEDKDKIVTLQAENAELRAEVEELEKARWHSTSETVPDDNQFVLIPEYLGELSIVQFRRGQWYEDDGDLRVSVAGDALPPNYWMPLPEPPLNF